MLLKVKIFFVIVVLSHLTLFGYIEETKSDDINVIPVSPWAVKIEYKPKSWDANLLVSLCSKSGRWKGKTRLASSKAIKTGYNYIWWNFSLDNFEWDRCNVEFQVIGRYCEIDLSGGPNAESYPVKYISKQEADVHLGGSKLVLRLIEPGPFNMSIYGDVTLTKPYYIGVCEVTQMQYELVMGKNPSYYTEQINSLWCPVEQVSFYEVRGGSYDNFPSNSSFIDRLRSRTGLSFDLPTEAQWEYACRAGTSTKYNYGDKADDRYMWFNDGVNRAETHRVGETISNAWGLYDMHGNVQEMCFDTNTSGIDPVGDDLVVRGGSINKGALDCTSFSYSLWDGRSGSKVTGFRIVLNL